MGEKTWKWMLILTGGLGLLLAVGSGGFASDGEKSTVATIKEEAQETLERGRAYAEEKRAQYERAIEDQLDKLDARIQALKEQLGKAEVQAKAEIEEQLDELRAKKQAVAKRLADLRVASEEAWQELKTGINTAMQELKESVDRALKRFD